MSHNNSFANLIKLLNPSILESAIATHESDKYSKNMNTKTHLFALMFTQIINPHSLRDLEIQLSSFQKNMAHMGMNKVTRSSFSDANRTRSSDTFKDIVEKLIPLSQLSLGELTDCISILDSSTITIKGRGSEWTEDTKIRTGQGLKIHAEYLYGNESINSIYIKPTNINDITASYDLEIRDGWTYLFDKGYYDYNWWHRIHISNAFFVTRAKKNAKITILKERKLDKKLNPYIKSDNYVVVGKKHISGGKLNSLVNTTLRLIVAINPEDNKEYTFITNNLSESPSVIAGYYKMRWAIELLFKWLKQNLKIKKFLCRNENGIKVQIYAAIITYILLGMYKRMHGNHFNRMIDLISHMKTVMFTEIHQRKIKSPDRSYENIKKKNLCLSLYV